MHQNSGHMTLREREVPSEDALVGILDLLDVPVKLSFDLVVRGIGESRVHRRHLAKVLRL